MKRQRTVMLSVLAGIGVGAAVVQGLHAQAKPPAYVVIPILKINDTGAFKAGVLDKGSEIAASLKAADGHFVIRSEEFTRLDGNPPQRLIVIEFDSIDKAQAWANSPTAKEVNAVRMGSTNSLSFIVEGTTN